MASQERRSVDTINALLHEDEEELQQVLLNASPDELNNVLFRAVMLTDKAELLSIILDAGADIDYQDKEGRTALFMAVKYNQLPMIELLLERNCNVNRGKYNQSSALHLAAKRGSSDVIRVLVNAGHEIDVVNWGGNTALLIACRFGHKEAVETLMAWGANVNICNKLGHYPLHYAAFAGDGNLVSSLLRKDANADVRTHLGISPIMLACERKHCSVVEVLAAKSDLQHREQLYGGTVLHWVVASGCSLCMEFLLSQGATLTIPDHSGRTPLMEAVQSNHPRILKYLLDQHAETPGSFQATSANGGLLHLAAELRRTECARTICRHSLTKHLINQRDLFQDCPFDFALQQGQKDMVKVLLKHGATESRLLPELDGLVSGCMAEQQWSDLVAGDNDDNIDDDRAPSGQSDASVCTCATETPHSQQSAGVGSKSPRRYGSDFANILRNNLFTKFDRCSQGRHHHHKCEAHDSGYMATPSQMEISETVDEDLKCCMRDCVMDSLVNTCLKLANERCPQTVSNNKVFKTYSAVKMAMIDMLRSASGQQMVAPVKFDFNTWLDNGPEAFVLKVTSLDLTDWLHERMHTPWSLRELCRGCIRRALGYRASDKVARLPVPSTIQQYLNMKELDDLQTSKINIRGTGAFDDIDVE